jgi:hypothetical protein
VLKRTNEPGYIRALMLLGIMLANYTTDLLLLLILIFNINLGLITIICVLFFNFLAYRLSEKYYFDNGKYKLAIEYYEPKFSSTTKKILGLFALILVLSSTALFIWIGISIGKQQRKRAATADLQVEALSRHHTIFK